MRTGEGTRGAGLITRWKHRQGRDAVGGEGGATGLVAIATHERSRVKRKVSAAEGSALMFNFFP
jgi:hypothetical protein